MAKDKSKIAYFFLFFLLDITFLILYRTVCSFEESPAFAVPDGYSGATQSINPVVYLYYTHIIALTVIGYGYFYSFGRNGSLGAIFYALALTATALQWGLLVVEFWSRVHTGDWDTNFNIDVYALINAAYPTVTVLITFGTLLGKASYIQLTFIAFIEIILYGLNKYILQYNLNIPAYEHELYVFEFGGFFGLGALYFYNKKFTLDYDTHKKIATSTTNLSAIFGTLFIFAFFPSFNAALNPPAFQNRVIVNTFLALASGTFTALTLSPVLNGGKWVAAEVRNGALAGAIAISSSIGSLNGPAPAAGVGMVASAFVIFSIHSLDAKFAKSSFRDFANVSSLNIVASLVGGVGSMIAIAVTETRKGIWGADFESFYHSDTNSAEHQVAAYFITFGISFFSGLAVGAFFSVGAFKSRLEAEAAHNDEDYIVPTEETVVLPVVAAAPQFAPVQAVAVAAEPVIVEATSVHVDFPEPAAAPVVVAPVVVAQPPVVYQPAVPVVSRTQFSSFTTADVAEWLSAVGVSHDNVQKSDQDGLLGSDILECQEDALIGYFGVVDGPKVFRYISSMPVY